MPAGADASRGQILYRPETVYAETPPANAPTTRVRFTDETLHHKNTTVISEEIRSDRQRSDLILASFDVDGAINAELTYANFDDFFQAGLGGTWATNVLRNGTVNRSFNIEKGFMDIAKFISHRGMVVNTLEINVQTGAIVQLAIGFVGSAGYPTTASIAGTTPPTQPNAFAPMSSGPTIKLLNSGGANIELGLVDTKEVVLRVNNNARLRNIVTKYETDDPGRGVQEITGTLNAYFKDLLAYSGFVANQTFSLQFGMSDPSDNTKSYRITLPKCKVPDMNPVIGGVESDVMLPIEFRALLDGTLGYTINFERAVTLP